jgi:hypothetical protein
VADVVSRRQTDSLFAASIVTTVRRDGGWELAAKIPFK